MKYYDKVIFELSKEGRVAYSMPPLDVEEKALDSLLPDHYLRKTPLELPEVSEIDVIRHFTALSNKNYGVDTGFYPLGSCTMKYNPKLNEETSSQSRLSKIHPYQPPETVQGALEIMYHLGTMLSEVTGMDEFTLQPAAGAHGELTGLMMIKAYHQKRGDTKRTKIIVPTSAHGTNPATATVVGFDTIEIPSDENALVDLEALKAVLSDEIAGLMLTNPNTLGLFEQNIREVADLVHAAGGLLYYDGANMNAIMGISRPGDMGFDVVHLNLHKTFSTPHGGGGPGAGPVGVKQHLIEFLPVPIVEKQEQSYVLNYDRPHTIGKIKNFYGNFGLCVRAYTYILTMGAEGLKKASETAVLNANYIMAKLKDHFYLPFEKVCKHEFVFGGVEKGNKNIATIDFAKRLLDYGIHPPTIYFPLIVENCMMIEPTETESKETLDAFCDIMIQVAKEARENYELLKTAPHNTPVRRLDEAKAARTPVLTWRPVRE